MIRGITALSMLSPQTAEKLIKSQEQINQLHDVLSTLRVSKQNQLVRRLVRKTQDGTLGQPTNAESGATQEDDVEEDADKIVFGDTITNNTTNPVAPVAAAKAIWPLIAAATIGGLGLGAAATALPTLLKEEPPVVVTPADSDTQYDLQFKEDQ